MASINFRTKGRNKQDSSVYVTFRNGRDVVLETVTRIIIPNSDYLVKGKCIQSQKFHNRLEVEDQLVGLRKIITGDLIKTKEYTKEWLKDLVNDFHGIKKEDKKNPLLTSLLDTYVKYITNQAKEERAYGTIKTYVSTRGRIEKFEDFREKALFISDIDMNFKDEFIEWSRVEEKYSPTTYLKTLKQIKTALYYAKSRGYSVNLNFFEDKESIEPSKKQQQKTKPLFLNMKEIEALMEFKGKEHLEIARDWLVISCFTACRVSDLFQLTSDNVQITIQGDKSIKYTQAKTNDTVVAPYHTFVDQILNRRNGEFPPKQSEQKYNKHIKEVCQLTGIHQIVEGAKPQTIDGKKRIIKGRFPKHELITSHIGRRSFASNLYGKIATESIMLVTGHDTIKDFFLYVGEEPTDHVKAINDFYRLVSTSNLTKSEKLGTDI
jgi:hypothetical protein